MAKSIIGIGSIDTSTPSIKRTLIGAVIAGAAAYFLVSKKTKTAAMAAAAGGLAGYLTRNK